MRKRQETCKVAGVWSGTLKIPFSAYADDCTVTGGVALDADRLSDFLAVTEEFKVDDAEFRALDDGRVVEADSGPICLADLCVVMATGPRGRQERRLWTRQVPVRIRIGPYSLVGYLHAPPTVDPFKSADRRPIVALTAAIVEYTMDGTVMRDEADVILVNRRRIDRLEAADEHEIRLAGGLDLKTAVDPRSKDMTGDLYG